MNKYVKELRKLEPVFKRAGELALGMQKSIKSTTKSDSGFLAVDIVTQADLDVQEYILKEMVNTNLVQCKLLAEEDTPNVGKFSKTGRFTLTIDPINGTLLYSRGEKGFDMLICLRDDKNLLYTYDAFPRLNWTNIIYDSKHIQLGQKPQFKNWKKYSKVILLKYHREKLALEKKIMNDLVDAGYQFMNISFSDAGEIDLENKLKITTNGKFLSGLVAGIYMQSPVVYDGLVALHLAQVKNYQLYKSRDFTLSSYKKDGLVSKHPGNYLVIQR